MRRRLSATQPTAAENAPAEAEPTLPNCRETATQGFPPVQLDAEAMESERVGNRHGVTLRDWLGPFVPEARPKNWDGDPRWCNECGRMVISWACKSCFGSPPRVLPEPGLSSAG